MDLWCDESTVQVMNEGEDVDCLEAFPDENILNDERVLERLLQSESRCLPSDSSHIFTTVQTELLPGMRKILTNWMLEVCEELNCSEVVFPLSVNYVDRFLSLIPVKKCHLQLLGAVSLLIASKLRQCKSLHPQDLVFFSDNSFSVSDVTDWEMLVLTTLKWDVSVVISTDFLDHLLLRLQLINDSWSSSGSTNCTNSILSKYHLDAIRSRASDLCLYSSTESEFIHEVPSMVATSSIAASFIHILMNSSGNETSVYNNESEKSFNIADLICRIVDKLHEITAVEKEKMLKMIQILLESSPLSNESGKSNQSIMVSSTTKSYPMLSVIVTGSNGFNEQPLDTPPTTPTDETIYGQHDKNYMMALTLSENYTVTAVC